MLIFSYPNSTDNYLYLDQYLYNYTSNNNITINLTNEVRIENNIFGYVFSGIEIVDLETIDGEVIITAKPGDASKVKDVVEELIPNVEYTIDERGWYPKEKVTLEGEELDQFKMALEKFENIDDVTNIYHNVDLGE